MIAPTLCSYHALTYLYIIAAYCLLGKITKLLNFSAEMMLMDFHTLSASEPNVTHHSQYRIEIPLGPRIE